METSEVHTVASHIAVAEAIRRWIALGTLEAGDRLPAERKLAERLGVGRMTIRHAMRLLADDGLVETRRGRSGGTFVLDDAERPTRQAAVTTQLLADVHDNFEFRLGVEPLATRLAAERAEPMERWAIRGLAEGQATGIRGFRTLDSRFHLAVAEASRNRLIIEAVRQARTEFFRWADAAWERISWTDLPTREQDFSARHRPIAEAIQAGDGALAEKRMSVHLLEGLADFLAIIDDPDAASPRRATR